MSYFKDTAHYQCSSQLPYFILEAQVQMQIEVKQTSDLFVDNPAPDWCRYGVHTRANEEDKSE
jgi:hypothetical protein